MPVLIDDLPVDIDTGPLGDVLLAAQQRIEPQGRIIVEVLLDGEPLIGDALVERQDEHLGDSILSLLTADPRELVIDTLGEIHRQLQAAGEYQTEAAGCLQRDDEQAALERIGEAMTIWQQTERAVRESAQIMEVSLDDLKIGGQTFSQLTAGLIAQLESLRDLLQARDTVAVADTLQYEWPETTMRWQQAVEKLVERIRA
jgi:hypothetical protein